jgi:hypothetical protein
MYSSTVFSTPWATLTGCGLHSSKPLLPLVCYVFQDGPWRDTLVRFRYDPRREPEARLCVYIPFPRSRLQYSVEVDINDCIFEMRTILFRGHLSSLDGKTGLLLVLKSEIRLRGPITNMKESRFCYCFRSPLSLRAKGRTSSMERQSQRRQRHFNFVI